MFLEQIPMLSEQELAKRGAAEAEDYGRIYTELVSAAHLVLFDLQVYAQFGIDVSHSLFFIHF